MYGPQMSWPPFSLGTAANRGCAPDCASTPLPFITYPTAMPARATNTIVNRLPISLHSRKQGYAGRRNEELYPLVTGIRLPSARQEDGYEAVDARARRFARYGSGNRLRPGRPGGGAGGGDSHGGLRPQDHPAVGRRLD